MAGNEFTNTHLHIFSSDCVPDNFLRVMPQKFLKRIAPQLLNFLKTDAGKNTLRALRYLSRNRRSKSMYDRYISFLGIGLQENQTDVLKIELETVKAYDPQARTVILTLNMDCMDDVPAKYHFNNQLTEVMGIKRQYADTALLFLGVDPRMRRNHRLAHLGQGLS